MSEKTHAEIIDWMRKSSTGPQELADMLEAAHKHEVATTKESLAVGNSGDCAKLREALEKVAASAEYAIEQDDLDRGDLLGFIEEMGQDARAALDETEQEGGAK